MQTSLFIVEGCPAVCHLHQLALAHSAAYVLSLSATLPVLLSRLKMIPCHGNLRIMKSKPALNPWMLMYRDEPPERLYASIVLFPLRNHSKLQTPFALLNFKHRFHHLPTDDAFIHFPYPILLLCDLTPNESAKPSDKW